MVEQKQHTPPDPIAPASYTIKPRDRYWEVRDDQDELVCLTVYKRGAVEVVRRLVA